MKKLPTLLVILAFVGLATLPALAQKVTHTFRDVSISDACAELPCPVLFIIDACYSGLMTGGTWPNIAVLASSDKETKSVDSRDLYSRSRFTDSLIREVQGGISRRESLTLEELYDRLLDDCKGPAQPELKNMSHEIKVLEYE